MELTVDFSPSSVRAILRLLEHRRADATETMRIVSDVLRVADAKIKADRAERMAAIAGRTASRALTQANRY